MMQTKVDGDWIQVERSVPVDVGRDIISMAVEATDDGANSVSLSVTGEETSFNSELPEDKVSEYIEIVTSKQPDDDTDSDSLPENFFERLSSRQRIFLQILLEHDEPVTGPEIREEMRTKYDQEVADSGSGTAGIISGFTRKYGKEFRQDLIEGRVSHHNDEGSRVFEHWIGDEYEEELRDYFDL